MSSRALLVAVLLGIAGLCALLLFDFEEPAAREQREGPAAHERAEGVRADAVEAPLAGPVAAAEPAAAERRELLPDWDPNGPWNVEVVLVAEADGSPVAHASLTAELVDAGLGVRIERRLGADGEQRLRLPEAQPWRLRITHGLLSSALEREEPALAEGERRRLEIELQVGEGVPFHVRVISLGFPVPGARIEAGGAQLRPLWQRTAADGSAVFWRTSSERGSLLVEADGYGPVVVVPNDDHVTPGTARVVPIDPAASLGGAVRDGTGPVAGARVRARVSGQEIVVGPGTSDRDGHEWTTTTDASGSYRLEGLTAEVPLRFRLILPGGEEVLDPEATELAPAETRRRNWDLGPGVRVFGRLHDSDGRPLPGLQIFVLRPPKGFVPTDGALLYSPTGTALPNGTTTTAEDGSFTLEDLRPGWWILALTRDSLLHENEPVAPFGRVTQIPEGVADLSVELVAPRGLYISGTVRTADDGPLPHVRVTAVGDAVEGELTEPLIWSRSSFRLGPLLDREYDVVLDVWGAGPSGRQWAPPDPVRVRAGTSGLEFVLEAGGRLHLTLDGPEELEGRHVTAELWMRPEARRTAASTPRLDLGITADALAVGTWDVFVHSAEFTAVLRGVEVREGAELERDVRLEPAAFLAFRGAPQRQHAVILEHEGTPIRKVIVGPDRRFRVPVPPGALAYRIRSDGKEIERRAVTLGPGETASVLLPSGD